MAITASEREHTGLPTCACCLLLGWPHVGCIHLTTGAQVRPEVAQTMRLRRPMKREVTSQLPKEKES